MVTMAFMMRCTDARIDEISGYSMDHMQISGILCDNSET